MYISCHCMDPSHAVLYLLKAFKYSFSCQPREGGQCSCTISIGLPVWLCNKYCHIFLHSPGGNKMTVGFVNRFINISSLSICLKSFFWSSVCYYDHKTEGFVENSSQKLWSWYIAEYLPRRRIDSLEAAIIDSSPILHGKGASFVMILTLLATSFFSICDKNCPSRVSLLPDSFPVP